MKKTVNIIYDYFTPAYKAGGPIQSLANLINMLKDEYEFCVITGAYDKGDRSFLPEINPGEWNMVNNSKIFYWPVSLKNVFSLFKQYSETKDNIHYINGIYSPWFNILPLFLYKDKIVLAPRGMLHDGALSQKSIKKKFFLFFFKLFGWHKKIVFHATDEKEMEFIEQQFGNDVKVFVAPNVPKNIGQLPLLFKNSGELNLVSVALIGPMKNHHLVLSALKKVNGKVKYNIYGPVINKEYWNECLKIIKELPENVIVNYHHELPPDKVKEVLAENHMFILPSVSENFGHAIFESFSAGKPVITSNNTPWKNLQDFNAGWNTDTSTDALTKIINEACDLKNSDYEILCNGAKAIADNYFSKVNFSQAYKQLFT